MQLDMKILDLSALRQSENRSDCVASDDDLSERYGCGRVKDASHGDVRAVPVFAIYTTPSRFLIFVQQGDTQLHAPTQGFGDSARGVLMVRPKNIKFMHRRLLRPM